MKIELMVRCARCHGELNATVDLDARDPECSVRGIGPTVWVEPCMECLSDAAEESAKEEVDQ